MITDSQLTLLEENELKQHEIIIEKGLKVFQEVGNALLAIRDKKLYRENYSTFEAYCANRWHLRERRAYQLMDAAQTIENLKAEPMVQLLENERQVRVLSKFDTDLHPAILKIAAAQAETLHVPFTAGLLERTGEIVASAVITGCVDTGNGESTPLTAALTKAEEEAHKRSLQYLIDKQNGRGMKPKMNYAGDENISQGQDYCQTPAYALDPLLPYLRPFQYIWEPAAGEGNLVKAFLDAGWGTGDIVPTDILNGDNFFDFQPLRFDVLVTNPPYSIKYKWLERCYALDKPFALLVPVETIGAKTAQDLMQSGGFEMMLLDHRVNFKMPNKGYEGSAQFPVLWLCHHVLPEQVMFGHILY